MILLSARDLSRQFDAEPLFRGVTFDLRAGDRVGLVGPNGAGKTTLLHVLADLDHSDTGAVETPGDVTVGLLRQRAEFHEDVTLRAEAESGLAHLFELHRESERIGHEIASATPEQQAKLQKRFDAIQDRLAREDAFALDHRVDEVLDGLGFAPEDHARPVTSFSGGQQSRILLAKLLLRAPEVMLLDEPTNHLDIANTEWLEGYLASRTGQAIVLVSHDRYFLDRVCTSIFELGGGRLSEYPGNFTAYWSQRAERQKVLERTYEKQQEMIARTEDFIRRNKYGQKSAQAADREKKLERVEEVERISDFAPPPMAFAEAARTGDLVLEAKNLTHGFDGETLFSGLNLRIRRGDRLGIVGPNGSGKTTLMRTLVGDLTPLEGDVRLGTHVNLGYYDQHLTSVPASESAVEAIRPEHKPEMTPGQMRKMLAKFGVKGDLATQKVGAMSGGERSKVALARLAALDANVLVLDEPTNHLDLWACDSLEEALKSFGGTILFVSHDRYFLDALATRVLVLTDEGCVEHEGNYSDYLHFRDAVGSPEPSPSVTPQPKSAPRATPAPVASSTKKVEPKTKRKRKFPYRKVSDIEAEILEKEELLEQLESQLADPEVHRDPDLLRDTSEAYEETQLELETLYEHWEEASELN